MSSVGTQPNVVVGGTEPLAVDANRIVREILPNIGLRSWRRYDSSGKCPRGYKVGGRRLWRVADLKLWAEWSFPDRKSFETRLAAEKGPAA